MAEPDVLHAAHSPSARLLAETESAFGAYRSARGIPARTRPVTIADQEAARPALATLSVTPTVMVPVTYAALLLLSVV